MLLLQQVVFVVLETPLPSVTVSKEKKKTSLSKRRSRGGSVNCVQCRRLKYKPTNLHRISIEINRLLINQKRRRLNFLSFIYNGRKKTSIVPLAFTVLYILKVFLKEYGRCFSVDEI